MHSWFQKKLEHWSLSQMVINVPAIFILPKMVRHQFTSHDQKVMTSFSSMCFSANIFWLPTSNIAMASFLTYHLGFSPNALYGQHMLLLQSQVIDICNDKPQLSLYFYLSQFSMSVSLIKIFIVISYIFLCSSSNHLQAYKCLYLLRNPLFITHALRCSDACQCQH